MSAEPTLSSALEPSGSSPGRALGAWIQRVRSAQALSVRALAARAGVSPSFVSQIENDVVSPSIASMERISSALGVTLGQYFAEAAGDAAHVIVRPADRVAIPHSWRGTRMESLAPRGGTHLQPLVIRLEAGGRSAERPHLGAVEEFVFVLSGRPTLAVGGKDYELRPSDAVTLPARELRRWENRTDSAAKILSLQYSR